MERALLAEHPNHAYLLHGPEQVGKTTLAVGFAQALNCQATTRPCGVCRPCRLIARDQHPDVRTAAITRPEPSSSQRASRARHSRVIGIDQVRALQHDATLAPYEGRWKVYVVINAELLSLDAMNCLLKTLEEPPPQVLLILTTTDIGLLLPTVVSRCQQIRLTPLPAPDLATALSKRYDTDPANSELVARLSGGRVGWAISAIEDPGILEDRSRHLADIKRLQNADLEERFAYAETLAQEYGREPARVAKLLHLWLGWWRDVLLISTHCLAYVSNYDALDELKRQASLFSVGQVQCALQAIQNTLERLAQNVNSRLALEILLIELPAARDDSGQNAPVA